MFYSGVAAKLRSPEQEHLWSDTHLRDLPAAPSTETVGALHPDGYLVYGGTCTAKTGWFYWPEGTQYSCSFRVRFDRNVIDSFVPTRAK